MKLEFRTPVHCTDGPFGELADVVIDPIARRVTHLVVAPHHQHGLARLVPIDLAAAADNGHAAISLRCTLEHARQLPSVQEFAYLRLGEFPAKIPLGTSVSRTSSPSRTTATQAWVSRPSTTTPTSR